MVVMILEKVPASLRGDLTRWLIEVNSGVYVGHISAMVRDRLWERCSESRGAGRVFQAWSTNNEQRFKMRVAGSQAVEVVDWEGVELVREKDTATTKTEKKRIRKQ